VRHSAAVHATYTAASMTPATRIARVLDLAPVILAGLFVAMVVAAFGDVRGGIGANSDQSTVYFLAETMRHPAAGRQIIMGDSPWYEMLWLFRATSSLPHHWFVWQMIPFVLWVTCIALGYAVARGATNDRRSGLLAAALLAAPGFEMRWAQWSPANHGVAIVHTLVLLLVVVVVSRDERWLHGRRLAAGLAALVPVTAVGAIDQFVVICGLVPLLAAAAFLTVHRTDGRLLRIAAAFAVLTLAGRTVLVSLGASAGIRPTGRVFSFVDVAGTADQLSMLPPAVGALVSVNAWGTPMSASGAIWLLAGVTGCAVMGAMLVTGLRRLWVASAPLIRAASAPQAADADAEEREETVSSLGADDLTHDAVMVFAGVGVAAAIAIWATAGVVFDTTSARYLVVPWAVSSAALPILGVRTGMRVLTSLAALIVVGASTMHFATHRPQLSAADPNPVERDAAIIRSFAAKHGVTHGYGPFWDAAAISWHSRFALTVYPVQACGPANCRFSLGTASDWYVPKGGPTILVTDSQLPGQPAVDPVYGEPIATLTHDTFTVRVYRTDIGTLIR
jgi:hypothetical protein